ncbi:helix-turn-helix transcriptional regulator [Paenibacillus alba]|uniref:helix-turn-helix transcriptional regulator n=1 Tax=Paenibacillus alba TaxID=1197127 RepID=UPI001FE89498|nr:helix-turn-helix transcriptional regulator [Paenibacillus alba]
MPPLIAEAYGLSEREKQILDGLLRGFSTKELALSLRISTYTVQDHLKSIFVKTGVTSRRELIWAVILSLQRTIGCINETCQSFLSYISDITPGLIYNVLRNLT